ncbi:VOC family protein [Citricoccus sp. SGAir0253]|uniref:VOC family protein n=1 Tax=Citricoccus sp. SGAir0253 TaxID=2567881 RepID=UPI0010CD6276|nr:VOC family protein [Citricoccus sp. SGAir0253]QCU78032.1 VOC family protein [Citricoccus sp. SGAir0253]
MAPPPYGIQLCVDCARPHELADWWAEALRWDVEVQDEAFIRRMVAEGQATEAETTTHRGRLVWRAGAAIIPPPGDGGAPDRPRILFQTVPEAKSVKNRVHWDLREPGADDGRRAAELERLLALGARRVGAGRQGPWAWTVLQDPEGNEFCL